MIVELQSGKFDMPCNNSVSTNAWCEWAEVSYDVSNNSSTVKAQVYIQKKPSATVATNGTFSGALVVNDAPKSIEYIGSVTNKTAVLVGEMELVIAHDPDGNKEITIFASIENTGTAQAGTYSGSATCVLCNILRVSDIRITDNGSEITEIEAISGTAFTVDIIKYIENYTDNLVISAGNTILRTIENITSACEIILSHNEILNLYDASPYSIRNKLSFTITSFNNDIEIGSSTCTIDYVIPESIKPSNIEDPYVLWTIGNLTNIDGEILEWNSIIQNKSAVIATLSVNAGRGAKLSSISIKNTSVLPVKELYHSGDDIIGLDSLNNYEIHLLNINTPGENQLTITAVDSRGRSSTGNFNIYVCSYSSPLIKSIKTIRCDVNGNTENNKSEYQEDGYTYFKPVFEVEYSSCNKDISGQDIEDINIINKYIVSARYKVSSADDSTYQDIGVVENNGVYGGEILSDASYTIEYIIRDAFDKTSVIDYISNAQYVLHLKHGGKAIGLGTVSGEDNTITINKDWDMKSSFNTNDKIISCDSVTEFTAKTMATGSTRFCWGTLKINDDSSQGIISINIPSGYYTVAPNVHLTICHSVDTDVIDGIKVVVLPIIETVIAESQSNEKSFKIRIKYTSTLTNDAMINWFMVGV